MRQIPRNLVLCQRGCFEQADDQRDRKSDHDCEHNQEDGPIWNVDDRKNLRDALSGNDVSNRDFVNVAPLQLVAARRLDSEITTSRPQALSLLGYESDPRDTPPAIE